MVDRQIAARGIRDEKVLDAMRTVPRHLFLEETDPSTAYGDFPVPIGFEQTISQPYIVAYMTEALTLNGTERVLEIGTGSGYQTAILAELAAGVFSIEVNANLLAEAKARLKPMGYENITFKRGNGRLGWPAAAPFEAVIVTAAPEVLPAGLIRQLVDGGRLVIPIGKPDQTLMRYVREGEGYRSERLLGVRFVPLV